MQKPHLTAPWAITLVSDPARAATESPKRRRSAWFTLMAARGHYCRYPGFPAPKLSSDTSRMTA